MAPNPKHGYSLLNRVAHILTRLKRQSLSNAFSPFTITDELPGFAVQTKSRTTILWHAEHWIVTYLLFFYYNK